MELAQLDRTTASWCLLLKGVMHLRGLASMTATIHWIKRFRELNRHTNQLFYERKLQYFWLSSLLSPIESGMQPFLRQILFLSSSESS